MPGRLVTAPARTWMLAAGGELCSCRTVPEVNARRVWQGPSVTRHNAGVGASESYCNRVWSETPVIFADSAMRSSTVSCALVSASAE